MDKYNNFQKTLNEPSFCTKIICFPFKLINISIKSVIFIFTSIIKTILILFLILSPPAYLYWKSQNFYSGSFELSSLNTDYELKNNDEIKIYTDEYGFPHIKANNIEDAYFGLGFSQAKNRLWQIDMNRRIARGTLSEIFGEKTLETDKFMRSIGHNEYALKNSKLLEKTSEHYNLIKAFIAGINYFGNNFKLPIEYYISFTEFKNFTLPDMIATISLFGMSMSQDYAMEVWYQYMEKNLGKEMAQKIVRFRDVDYPFWDTTIVSDDELKKLGLYKKNKDKKKVKEEYYTETKKESNKNKNTNKEKIENIDDSIIGDKLKNEGASNCWNVHGNFTNSGKPLLCNDPHLPNGMPGMLFIAKMYLPDNVLSGACLPGTPVFITGSNSYISWGITTENTDNSDFCEELIQGDYYIKDNIKHPLEIIKDAIYIKGNKSVEIEIKKTKNGPIIGKTVPAALTLLNEPYTNSLPLSLRVAYMNKNFTSFSFFFRINFAHSQNDFLPYKQMLTFPNINLHWITKNGEIGWDAIGIITVKNYHDRFCHGYVSEDDVIKEIPLKEMLHKYNPEKGYIVSANNKPASENYLYELRGHHNNFRAHRIVEILENLKKNNKKVDVQYAAKILNDVKDTNAEYILPKYLEMLERHNKNVYKLKNNKYYTLLKNWDYEMSYNSQAATVFSVLERQIGAQLLKNEYKTNETYIESPVLNYLFYWNYVSGIIDKIYKGEKIKMEECRIHNGYSYEEDCEKFIVKIFDNLDEYMKPYINEDGNIKKWGEINFNYFPHATFDKLPVLNNKITYAPSPNNNMPNEINKFSIMSYNVRNRSDTLRNNVDGSAQTRSKYVINNILLYKPDSVGFQEVIMRKNKNFDCWYKFLTEGLKDFYIGVGQGRDDKSPTEGTPIFFNKYKFDLIEQGTKWLSPTPDIPFTKFEEQGDGYRRTLTYVILKNKMTGNIYMHVNTHLDFKVKENRIRQIKVVQDFISKYKDKFPVLLTGDFNSGRNKGDAVLYLIDNGYSDSAYEAPNSFKHWTFPAIGYNSNVYGKCLKRKTHKNYKVNSK